MLGFLVDFAAMILGRAVANMREPPVPKPPRPPPMRVEATAVAYRTWAAKRGFVRDDRAHTYSGKLCRHAVVVAPGLAGSAPIGVEVEIALGHAALAPNGGSRVPVLLRPSDKGSTELEEALAGQFNDPDLSGALRSIALTPDLVRLRFAALTPPRLVEQTVVATVEAIAARRRESRATPYR